MTYRPRLIDRELDLLLGDLSAVSLDGPKGVGRTKTALQRANRVFRLDQSVDRELLAARPTCWPAAMRQWLTAYAAATTTPSTYETIRDAATPGVSNKRRR